MQTLRRFVTRTIEYIAVRQKREQQKSAYK